METKRKASLERINELLAELKKEIKEYCRQEDNPNEVVLFIEDKKTNPYRKQTEDIEGDVNDMQMMGR